MTPPCSSSSDLRLFCQRCLHGVLVTCFNHRMRRCLSRTGSGEFGLYLRDIILGINDGTVSMFNLLVGVTGGNSCQKEVSPCVLQRCDGFVPHARSPWPRTS